MLVSPITALSPRGGLLRASKVIWDEAPMANRAVPSWVDDTLQRVMGNRLPFGGKVVVLAGDFRQRSPVVARGTRADVVDASIKSSPLWPLFTVYRLTVRLRNSEDLDFATWIDDIGEGRSSTVALDMFQRVETMQALIDFVFPRHIVLSPPSCLKRAILCPTNAQVNSYNDVILGEVDGARRTYLAADTLREAEDAGDFDPQTILDYVARQTPPGLPNHTLHIVVNGVYRLLRNFSIDSGLVKNVRVVIKDVGQRIVVVRILKDINGDPQEDETNILIPRINFTHEIGDWGHTLLRRQLPLALAPAYATTFNSCQGLTLDLVALDLTRPVFSHGQLYTAGSRVRRRENAIVRLRAEDETTTNITYNELLL